MAGIPEQGTINFNLERFVKAQQLVYANVLKELQNGNKQTHWMWFIFPQIDGLGKSSTAKFYALKDIEETKAYFNHPVLGKRLLACTQTVLEVKGKSVDEIFGSPDNVKLQSCMTLFSELFPQEPLFNKVLSKFYNDKKDMLTIEILNNNNAKT